MNINYRWLLPSFLPYYLLKTIMPSFAYTSSLRVGARRAEDRGPGWTSSSLSTMWAGTADFHQGLVGFGLPFCSFVVVWKWWGLYYECTSDSRKGLWIGKVLVLPTNFGFVSSHRASYKLGLLAMGTLNLHPSAGNDAQRGKDHEPVFSGPQKL